VQHKNPNLDAFQAFLAFTDDIVGDEVHALAILGERTAGVSSWIRAGDCWDRELAVGHRLIIMCHVNCHKQDRHRKRGISCST
jgi:hypothetical protein